MCRILLWILVVIRFCEDRVFLVVSLNWSGELCCLIELRKQQRLFMCDSSEEVQMKYTVSDFSIYAVCVRFG